MSQVRSGSLTAKRFAKACLLGIKVGSFGDWPTFPDSEARLNRLPLKYLRDIIVDACVAGKPPTEASIEAASQRHAVEMQDQSACCGCVF